MQMVSTLLAFSTCESWQNRREWRPWSKSLHEDRRDDGVGGVRLCDRV